jgi:hypothetical protein
MRSPVAAAIAIGVGLVVLLGFFIPTADGNATLAQILALRFYLIDWAVTLAAFASLVAIIGLVSTHWRKLRARRAPDRYSFFALVGFVLVVLFGIFAYTISGDVRGFQMIVNSLQVPIETSLLAVLAVTLTLALFRLFQNRRGLLPLVFAFSVLVYLLMNSGLLTGTDSGPMRYLLVGLQTLPIAGGRGILLGIALGSIMAGLRILLGAERPYSG